MEHRVHQPHLRFFFSFFLLLFSTTFFAHLFAHVQRAVGSRAFTHRFVRVPLLTLYAVSLTALAARANWAVLLLFFVPSVIGYLAFRHLQELQNKKRLLLQEMTDAVDLHDPYTGGHSRRVAALSEQILKACDISGAEAELIITAARVHDIGKVGVAEQILLKPGPLTPQERAIMETHSTIGADLLKRYPDFARGHAIVLHHHERWDGKGYPAGLKALEIPLGARIIAVADSFDAMTSDRPYRRAYSREKALRILQEGCGSQWDPRIVDAFVTLSAAPNAQESISLNLPAESLYLMS